MGELCGNGRTIGFDAIAVETHKVVDTQAIDIGVIRDALLGKIGTQIGAVGTDSRSKLLQREVVSQIEMSGFTMLVKQLLDIIGNGQ